MRAAQHQVSRTNSRHGRIRIKVIWARLNGSCSPSIGCVATPARVVTCRALCKASAKPSDFSPGWLIEACPCTSSAIIVPVASWLAGLADGASSTVVGSLLSCWQLRGSVSASAFNHVLLALATAPRVASGESRGRAATRTHCSADLRCAQRHDSSAGSHGVFFGSQILD